MPHLRLRNAPIIEAVVDINCDIPPAIDLTQLEDRAKELFRDRYPKTKRRIVQEHEFRAEPEKAPQFSVQQRIAGLQFFAEDEKQLVQVRDEGYSFNRLAPYTTLDDYLPEIDRTWTLYRELTLPVQVRKVGLRFINRILLPMIGGRVELNDYLRVSPHLPDEETLTFAGFMNQHAAVEDATGNRVNITLAMQPVEGENLPIIFDIDTFDTRPRDPEQWRGIRETILDLRRLKNKVFERTLTEKCLSLFQRQ